MPKKTSQPASRDGLKKLLADARQAHPYSAQAMELDQALGKTAIVDHHPGTLGETWDPNAAFEMQDGDVNSKAKVSISPFPSDIGEISEVPGGSHLVEAPEQFYHYNDESDSSNTETLLNDELQAERISDHIVSRLNGAEVEFKAGDLGPLVFDALRRKLPAFEALVIAAGAKLRVQLPTEAPEKYQGLRDAKESPPAFVERVYGPWLGTGLDRAHIRNLDPVLSKAIDNWSSRKGNEWPVDLLPTRAEQNRRMVKQLRAEAPEGKIGSVLGEFTAREAGRIRSAIQRSRKQDS